MNMVNMIARGTTMEASWISSDIYSLCQLASSSGSLGEDGNTWIAPSAPVHTVRHNAGSTDRLETLRTRKCIDRPNKPYHKRETLRRPIPVIEEGFEDFGGILMRTQERQRKENGKKAENVDYKD